MSDFNPFQDNFAIITPRITGSLSVVSSSILIYLIMRSDTKLSTIYHRIMFGMAVADILSSAAMALTTIPMPRDLSNYGFDTELWKGTRLGNQQTCTAQGFFFALGVIAMYGYNASLCTYYTCVIFFKMKERTIVKYVERFLLHPGPIIMSLSLSIPPIVLEKYNPTNFDVWCTLSQGRGQGVVDQSVEESVLVLISLFLTYIVICFVLIIWRVVYIERQIRHAVNDNSHDRNFLRRSPLESSETSLQRRGELLNRVVETSDNTKVVFLQASAYILAFLVTLSMPFVRTLSLEESLWIFESQVILMPLQGLFNLIIFIAHKIYNYRRIHPNETRYYVLRKLFLGQAHDDVLLSRISLVSVNEEEDILNVQIENERNDVELIRIELSKSVEILSEDLTRIRSRPNSNDDDDTLDDNQGHEESSQDSQGLSGFEMSNNISSGKESAEISNVDDEESKKLSQADNDDLLLSSVC